MTNPTEALCQCGHAKALHHRAEKLHEHGSDILVCQLCKCSGYREASATTGIEALCQEARENLATVDKWAHERARSFPFALLYLRTLLNKIEALCRSQQAQIVKADTLAEQLSWQLAQVDGEKATTALAHALDVEQLKAQIETLERHIVTVRESRDTLHDERDTLRGQEKRASADVGELRRLLKAAEAEQDALRAELETEKQAAVRSLQIAVGREIGPPRTARAGEGQMKKVVQLSIQTRAMNLTGELRGDIFHYGKWWGIWLSKLRAFGFTVNGVAVGAAPVGPEDVPDSLTAPTLDERAAQRLATLRQLVTLQAEDVGLWCQADSIVEAYLQQELRKLHAAVEAIPEPEAEQALTTPTPGAAPTEGP